MDDICWRAVGSTGPCYVYVLTRANRTIQQLGASFSELTIAPATSTEPLPPLPEEVDDVHVFPNEIQPQQVGVVSLMTGFNTNVRIYLSYATLASTEMVFGGDEIFDWNRQQRIFEQSLLHCKHILDNIPDVLKIQPQGGRDIGFHQQRQPYYPPMPEFSEMRHPGLDTFTNPEPQDTRCFEIQKANVYASHLSTRSFLVEKYFLQLEKFRALKSQSMLSSSPNVPAAGLDRFLTGSSLDDEGLEKLMSEEREQVVKDLLVVLGSIDMVNMEPNGDSFVSSFVHIYVAYSTIPLSKIHSMDLPALQYQEDHEVTKPFHRRRRFDQSLARYLRYQKKERAA